MTSVSRSSRTRSTWMFSWIRSSVFAPRACHSSLPLPLGGFTDSYTWPQPAIIVFVSENRIGRDRLPQVGPAQKNRRQICLAFRYRAGRPGRQSGLPSRRWFDRHWESMPGRFALGKLRMQGFQVGDDVLHDCSSKVSDRATSSKMPM